MAIDDSNIKELERIKRRENYLKNKDRILANNAKSRAKNRESILQGKKDYYHKVKSDPEWQAKEAEKRNINKEKKRLYDAQYHKLNSEKKKLNAKIWRTSNKEKRAAIVFNYDGKKRAIKKVGDSSKDILDWKKSQKKICYWCNKKCDDDFHIDHYVPLAKGGLHKIDNLVIACPTCNLTKNAKDPYEYASTVGRLF
jgi:5-methylcytosine-specific restriction endonuclease McrA